MIQGSAEWYEARLGKVTASRVADVVAKTKTGWGASRANYAGELIAERLTGKPTEGYRSPAMQWGTDNEAEARSAYEFRTDAVVTECGFIPHPTIGMAGASPDGLVADDGQVEIKCPNTATHIATLSARTVPASYVKQMQWQMACTGRQWCDFVSYDPRMPETMRLFIARVQRDQNLIEDLEDDVRHFLAEIDATVERLTSAYGSDVRAAA